MTDTADPYVVRPPKQERSRIAWERALDAGVALLEEGGLDAVTISAVCRRGRISPPSLYARVDGLGGLVAAVYERGMLAIQETEFELMAGLPAADTPLDERLAAAVGAMSETFRRHRTLLSAIIASSVRDERIHARGVEEALRVQSAMADALALPDQVGHDIAAMVFAEGVMRTVYGTDFSAAEPESEPVFRARLTRMALARARAADR